jgi:hypothetical protein
LKLIKTKQKGSIKMIKLSNIPEGSKSDTLESRVGTEELLAQRAAEHRSAAETTVNAVLDEAAQRRANALTIVEQAKAKQGQNTPDWDQRMAAKYGTEENRPASGAGRVNN